MGALEDTSLITGWLPVALTVAAALSLIWLVVRSGRSWWRVWIPACVVATALVTVAVYVIVEKIWHPFPDPLAPSVYVWIGIGVLAVVLGVCRTIGDTGVLRRIVTVAATILVVATAAAHVNLEFDAYPTVRSLFGPSVDAVAFDEVPRSTEPPSVPVSEWTPPADLPTEGKVASTPIPGTVSGFSARDAEIYFPPAYFASPRPQLPVLVLLAGQPGSPQDWLVGGTLTETMDTFAAQHDGLAPVVVVADGTGSEIANPLCVDSPLGNVATYLSQDVPAWIAANLDVSRDPSTLAIGGLSYGGTCAFQMTTNHPDVYPTFIDLSGQIEPTLGDRQKTIGTAFGGDAQAFAAVNPMDLLKTRQYPGVAGAFVVGSSDNEYRPGLQAVYEAAKAAGMDVHYLEVDGGHSFAVWSAGLKSQLDWLAQRTGLTR